jgi:hypothetical protein
MAVSVAAVMGSFILQPTDGGDSGLAIALPGARVTLPESCISLRIFNVTCPGCGLTRSFVATARGRLTEAFRNNAMGPVLYLILLVQIPYRTARILGSRPSAIGRLMTRLQPELVTWFIVGGLVGQWAVRLAARTE